MPEKHNVMIIDDEKIVGDMAKLSLEQDGYEVETFLDGASALARLQEKPFNVVVTDLKMKGWTAWRCCEPSRNSIRKPW